MGITEKSHETRRDRWVVTNLYFGSMTIQEAAIQQMKHHEAESRDFWLTLQPQRSLLVLWLFSVILFSF